MHLQNSPYHINRLTEESQITTGTTGSRKSKNYQYSVPTSVSYYRSQHKLRLQCQIVTFLNKTISTITITTVNYSCENNDKTNEVENIQLTQRKMEEKITNWKKVYACTKCGKVLTAASTLKRHMITHSDKRAYTCAICNRDFKTSQYLNKHIRIHSKETPHERTKTHFRQRRARKVSEEKGCESFSGVSSHIKTHKPYKCAICKESFDLSADISNHMKGHEEAIPLKCEVCEDIFMSLGSLTKHMKKHDQDKTYDCYICDKKFNKSSHLKAHIKTHFEDRTYKCDICDKGFKQLGGLHMHGQTHTETKPFQCTICSREFNQSCNLYRHMRIHYEADRFKCNICEKEFKTSDNLSRHKLTHSGARTHKCNICEKRFNQSCNLKRHLKTHNIAKVNCNASFK